MRYLFIVLVGVIAFAGICTAAAPQTMPAQPAVDELQAKIDRGLQAKSWSEASKAMVRAVWDDYKKAVADQRVATAPQTDAGRIPDPAADFIGSYRIGKVKGTGKTLEIRREQGILVVLLEHHQIPAVISNNTLVFTSGDVVLAAVPQVGAQPHADLEFFAIRRSGNGFSFGRIGCRESMPMSKAAE